MEPPLSHRGQKETAQRGCCVDRKRPKAGNQGSRVWCHCSWKKGASGCADGFASSCGSTPRRMSSEKCSCARLTLAILGGMPVALIPTIVVARSAIDPIPPSASRRASRTPARLGQDGFQGFIWVSLIRTTLQGDLNVGLWTLGTKTGPSAPGAATPSRTSGARIGSAMERAS